MRIKLPAETLATLQALGNTLTTANGDQWVYMPKWIKIVGPNTVEIVSFEHLPDDVKEAIKMKKG